MEITLINIRLSTPTNPVAVIEYGVWDNDRNTWAMHGEQVDGDISGLTTLQEAKDAATADAQSKGLI